MIMVMPHTGSTRERLDGVLHLPPFLSQPTLITVGVWNVCASEGTLTVDWQMYPCACVLDDVLEEVS